MPELLGPRLEQRGRYWSADLRPWGGERLSLRDPKAPGWKPTAGSPGTRTEDPAVARKWAQAYVDHLRDPQRRKALGVGRRARSLEDAGQEWLELRERIVAANTRASEATAVNHLVEWAGAGATTHEVDTDLLQGMFNSFLDQDYSSATLGTYRRALGRFCTWLGQTDDQNAARVVGLPDVRDPDAEPWDDDQLQAIREAADALDKAGAHAFPLRRAVELGICGGLRQMELFGIEWRAFRPEQCTARITRQLSSDARSFAPLKGKTNRTTLLLPDWWSWDQPEGRGLVLGAGTGGRVGHERHVQRDAIVAVLKEAGLFRPGVGWHSMRHTYARLFLEGGGYLEDLQRSLGHSSLSVTERTYGHLRPDFAAERARQRIYGQPGMQLVR
jgi:integrase